MVSPLSSISNFTHYGYGINFRSQEKDNKLNFVPKMRSPLTTDVFEKATNGGVNGSVDTLKKIHDLIPYVEIKKISPNARETERIKKIEEERKHIAQTITKRTEYNTRQLRLAGVPEREVKKYLTIDGRVNDEGKRILRDKGKKWQ